MMTTKSYSVVTDPYTFVMNGSGTDGKYETVNGRQRLKWNSYVFSTSTERKTPGKSSILFGDIWFPSMAYPGTSLTANHELQLLSRLSEQVKGHDFNLAVSAAEGTKTVNMVTKALSDLGGAALDLRRGNFASAARRLGVGQRPSRLRSNDVAGRWLELQYGWLPLLSDVYEASKAYEAISNGPRVSRMSVSITNQVTHNSSQSPINWSCEGPAKSKRKIIYEMTEVLSAPRSLSLTDPLSVAWELIPYSFVVDWFVPIGTYLSNLNAIPHLQGRFLTIDTVSFQGFAKTVNTMGYKFTKEPSTVTSYFRYVRTASTSLSVPTPTFNSLPEAMSPKRILNSIALAAQRFLR
jgi:hypothetical protein